MSNYLEPLLLPEKKFLGHIRTLTDKEIIKVKKTIIMIISAVMFASIIVAAGCGKGQKEEKKELSTFDKIKKAGEIKIGTNPDYPPFESVDDKGNIVGFDIDLVNAIAKELGVKANFVTMSFDSIITAVKNGQVDIGASSFSVNEERKMSIDFSIPYISTAQVILVKKDFDIKSLDDLNGLIVAVQMGTTCVEAAKGIKGVEVKAVDDNNVSTMMLKNGSVSAVVMDIAIANELASKHDFKVFEQALTSEDTAIVIKKGSSELKAAIDKAIKKFKADGTFEDLKKKWDIK
ncbi:MAG: basic amino acid ABC transporter substrate-binding protein [Gammaproteobacteria bacterium]|nr:MAG: basic amino acid ABC transporter substrate-binding protein [Deltaproteobacteria bacterium]PIE48134.1 MAG: basic amino acid ABC transporter substrate-binding protein [Gammaproteobacteria bacterium]